MRIAVALPARIQGARLYPAMQQHVVLDRVSRRNQRSRFAVLTVGVVAGLAMTGCGNQYRPVVSAINPVGPAGQPTKFAVVVSNPNSGTNTTTPGLLSLVDFSGDTVLATPQILPNPNYFVLDGGSNAFTTNTQGSLNAIPISASVITSNVKQTTLPVASTPVSMTVITPASGVPTVFIPQQDGVTGTIAALNSNTVALYDDIAVGNGGTNPVYVVGVSGTPRVYAISQNATGSLGQIDALESTSTLQLSDSSTIPVGIRPVYGVMTGDARRAFILNQGSDTVNVVNVPSNGLDVVVPVITIPPITISGGSTVKAQPTWADLAPTISDLVVLNKGDGIHPGTLSVIQIPLCNSIAQPTNPNCNAANPVDAVGFGNIVATATVGVNPSMVSVLQDGVPRAYVINGGNATTPGSVSVVNLASGAVTATIPCAADPTDITTPSASAIYGCNPNSISATSGTPTGKVYVTSSDSHYMSIIYTDSDTVQGHINLQGRGLRVLVTSP